MTEQRQRSLQRRAASRITALTLWWRHRRAAAAAAQLGPARLRAAQLRAGWLRAARLKAAELRGDWLRAARQRTAQLRTGWFRRPRRPPDRPDPQTTAVSARPAPDPAARPGASGRRPWHRIQVGLAAGGLRRIPLPLTTLVLLHLVLLPAALLRHLPRPRAVGLEQLQQQVGLLQSFPPSPERPLPALWRERLGARAETIWRHQRGPWWQLWSEHSDSPAMLVITTSALPGGSMAPLPPQALRVGDLVVIAPDPLSRLLLRDRLLPQQRLSRGLQRRCLERLRQDQAVLWNPAGLGVITGVLAPLLQRYERGCLSLTLGDGGLLWRGEAAERDSPWLASTAAAAAQPVITAPAPLPADLLLEIELGQAGLLLEGLLSRPLIRDPLLNRYGLDAAALKLLRHTPMRLRLRRLIGGPFQAGLELQLPLGEERQRWRMLLANLSRALLQQGLSPLAGPPPAGGPAARGAAGPIPSREGASWRRGDGVVVGGWRWIGSASDNTASDNKGELLFFLGPAPQGPLRPLPGGAAGLPGRGELRLRSRPQALASLELLPGRPPQLLRRADQLWIRALPQGQAGQAGPLSTLTGGLRLTP